MSSLIVQLCEIDEIFSHPNADRLDVIKIKGFYCVTGKGNFSSGDKAIYLPPEDSVLSEDLCKLLWKPDSKIKAPKNGRLKTERIRGYLSQGMALNPKDPELLEACPELANAKVGDDVASILGITKWEPKDIPTSLRGQGTKQNHNFKKYTDIENIKHYPTVFKLDDPVYISLKMHGTSFRAGYVDKTKLTFFEKIQNRFRQWLRLAPLQEFCVGSRNMQLNPSDDNLYCRIAQEYKLAEILGPREEVLGEIVGPNIQKDYTYGHDKPALYVYDVRQDGRYLDYVAFLGFTNRLNLPRVPLLFVGKLSSEDFSTFYSCIPLMKGEPVREGCVVKAINDSNDPALGRKVLKSINPDYLLRKNNTEWS